MTDHSYDHANTADFAFNTYPRPMGHIIDNNDLVKRKAYMESLSEALDPANSGRSPIPGDEYGWYYTARSEDSLCYIDIYRKESLLLRATIYPTDDKISKDAIASHDKSKSEVKFWPPTNPWVDVTMVNTSSSRDSSEKENNIRDVLTWLAITWLRLHK